MSETRQAIEDWMRTVGTTTVPVLAQAIGLAPSTARCHLESSEEIERTGGRSPTGHVLYRRMGDDVSDVDVRARAMVALFKAAEIGKQAGLTPGRMMAIVEAVCEENN